MSLREQLLARGLPETTVPIRKGRIADVKAARERLDEAVRLRDKSPGIEEQLEQEVRDARAALDALYEDVTVRAIPPADYETLVAEHPPTDEQLDEGMDWNPSTFVPALLAATVDQPWSEQEWVELCSAGPLALGEVADLFEAAVKINGRGLDLRWGKRLAADGQLALEMAVCAAYRIPHSVFLSWAPDDRDKALSWHLRQAEICKQCGTHPDDWDPKKGGHRRAFVAEILVCPGCEVRQREEHELSQPRWEKVRGAYVVMRRNVQAMLERRRHRGR